LISEFLVIQIFHNFLDYDRQPELLKQASRSKRELAKGLPLFPG
jgi:hypothetical protein